MSPERVETTGKKGIIFILLDHNVIQLEERTKLGDKFFGYTIIPGGGIKQNETPETALCREVIEEYGVLPLKFKKLGEISSYEENDRLNTRYVYLVTKWLGVLGNPEKKSQHIEVDLDIAKNICKHPISQQVLTLLKKDLF